MKKWMVLSLLALGMAQAKEIKLVEVLNVDAFTATLNSSEQEGSRTHQAYDLTYTQKNGRVLTFLVDAYSKPNSKVLNRITVAFDKIYDLPDNTDSREIASGTGYVLGFLTAAMQIACYNAKKPGNEITTYMSTLLDKLDGGTTATYVKEFGNTQIRFESSGNGITVSWAAIKLTGTTYCVLK